MKFTCLQENLSKGLNIVTKAVSTRAPLPILANVLIEAKDGRIRLTASDTETTITTYIGASIEEEGAITIPARIISEYISNLSPTSISAELKDSILHLKTSKSKTKFNGLDASNYPELPTIDNETAVLELDAETFSEAVLEVSFSAASDDTRPVLAGILLNYEGGYLTFVSADGFRLSEKILPIDASLDDFQAVIPAKTLTEVARIFSSSDEAVKMVLSEDENLAMFESGDILVSTRIIAGNFPDYKKLIPEEYTLTAEFSSQELLEAVRLTNVFAKNKDNHSSVSVLFHPDGYIKLTSVSQETGENNTEIEAVVEGEVLEISYNSKYLLDMLNNMKHERLKFSSNGNLTPGVVSPVDQKGYIHLIMPIRTQG